MVKKIILVIIVFAFCVMWDPLYGGQLNLPPPHGYGVPQMMDGIEKGRERRRQKKREKELYQRQLELQQQISNQKKEELIIDLIVDKASKGKMTEKDKKYLERHMDYESADIIWAFNESNK